MSLLLIHSVLTMILQKCCLTRTYTDLSSYINRIILLGQNLILKYHITNQDLQKFKIWTNSLKNLIFLMLQILTTLRTHPLTNQNRPCIFSKRACKSNTGTMFVYNQNIQKLIIFSFHYILLRTKIIFTKLKLKRTYSLKVRRKIYKWTFVERRRLYLLYFDSKHNSLADFFLFFS